MLLIFTYIVKVIKKKKIKKKTPPSTKTIIKIIYKGWKIRVAFLYIEGFKMTHSKNTYERIFMIFLRVEKLRHAQ